MTQSARARFILRYGVLRCGVPLGLGVATWGVVTGYSTQLGQLHTPAGRLRLVVILTLAFAEWTLGAGWVIGALLWAFRAAPATSGDGAVAPRSTPRASRDSASAPPPSHPP